MNFPLARRRRCPSLSDTGERCVKPPGHPGTSYLHETAPDRDGMITGWGAMPDGTEFVACPDCDEFGLVGATGSLIIAHDHTDNSHSWLRSDGDVGSIHIQIIDCD